MTSEGSPVTGACCAESGAAADTCAMTTAKTAQAKCVLRIVSYPSALLPPDPAARFDPALGIATLRPR